MTASTVWVVGLEFGEEADRLPAPEKFGKWLHPK
jgi:hypothetical protein